MYQCDFLFFYSTEKKCAMNKCKKKSVCFHHDFDIEVMLLIIICKKKINNETFYLITAT